MFDLGSRFVALPDGRQVQKRIGPAWTERGRPPAGYFTKRTADAWLAAASELDPHLVARASRLRAVSMESR